MGFFGSLREIREQAAGMEQDRSTGERLQDAQSQMAAAQAVMAEQTRAANLALSGLAGTATITGVANSGSSVNLQPILEIDLLVLVPGRPPVPVSLAVVVDTIFIAKARPGTQVPVKVDPADPQAVWIDWAAAA